MEPVDVILWSVITLGLGSALFSLVYNLTSADHLYWTWNLTADTNQICVCSSVAHLSDPGPRGISMTGMASKMLEIYKKTKLELYFPY